MRRAGTEVEPEIARHFDSAELILLLVSANFLASDYCYGKEMKHAMERHEAGQARVILIIVSPVDWHSAPFGKLLALPTDGKPITTWAHRDEGFLSVAVGIRSAVHDLLARTSQHAANLTCSARRQPRLSLCRGCLPLCDSATG